MKNEYPLQHESALPQGLPLFRRGSLALDAQLGERLICRDLFNNPSARFEYTLYEMNMGSFPISGFRIFNYMYPWALTPCPLMPHCFSRAENTVSCCMKIQDPNLSPVNGNNILGRPT